MAKRHEVIRYLLEAHYKGSVPKLSVATGFSSHQIKSWLSGTRRPHQSSVNWIIHKTFAPEFQVIAEYHPIDSAATSKMVNKQLESIFAKHKNASGLYAFYDSMASLVYLGKSNGSLFAECKAQLRAQLRKGIFPRGANNQAIELTSYVRFSVFRSSIRIRRLCKAC